MRGIPCLLLASGFFFAAHAAAGRQPPPAMAIRGWILLTYDMDYLQNIIRKAPSHGVNHIQLSHDILHHADLALTDVQRRTNVNDLAGLCHELGLDCFVWTHELRRPEPSMFRDGKVVVDESTWTWIRDRYNQFFDVCPDVDGLVVSFSEGDFRIDSSDEVISSYTVEEMFRHLIMSVYDVCRERGKTLIVRKFSDEALQPILEAPEDLVVMQKCTTADWQVYSANNPNLGTYGTHRQICEFDLAGEYVGQGEIPWCAPAYLQSRYRFAVGRGMVGMVARIDRNGRNAFGTPNEINIDFFSALLRDSDVDVERFWKRWATERFGEEAAEAGIAALRPTFELTTRLYWGDRIGDWRIQEHSKIPRLSYAISHDREYMFSPPVDVGLFSIPRQIEREMARRYGTLRKDTRRVIEELEENRQRFEAEDYAWLLGYLRRLDAAVEAFLTVHTAFIRHRLMEEKGATPDRMRALRADLARIRLAADLLEKNVQPPMELVNADRMRAFGAGLEKLYSAEMSE